MFEAVVGSYKSARHFATNAANVQQEIERRHRFRP
jgi:hypothetical protein